MTTARRRNRIGRADPDCEREDGEVVLMAPPLWDPGPGKKVAGF
jgi:hypothetical protein